MLFRFLLKLSLNPAPVEAAVRPKSAGAVRKPWKLNQEPFEKQLLQDIKTYEGPCCQNSLRWIKGEAFFSHTGCSTSEQLRSQRNDWKVSPSGSCGGIQTLQRFSPPSPFLFYSIFSSHFLKLPICKWSSSASQSVPVIHISPVLPSNLIRPPGVGGAPPPSPPCWATVPQRGSPSQHRDAQAAVGTGAPNTPLWTGGWGQSHAG